MSSCDYATKTATMLLITTTLLVVFLYAYHKYRCAKIVEYYERKMIRSARTRTPEKLNFDHLRQEIEHIKTGDALVTTEPQAPPSPQPPKGKNEFTKEELAQYFAGDQELKVGGVSLGTVKDFNGE